MLVILVVIVVLGEVVPDVVLLEETEVDCEN